MVTQTPLGRFGRPDNIAKIVVFLTSDLLLWELTADGGFH
jgi:NAD(P)-dependent dehydrogenase (short-subunit alcohol dehydrogenase family)